MPVQCTSVACIIRGDASARDMRGNKGGSVCPPCHVYEAHVKLVKLREERPSATA